MEPLSRDGELGTERHNILHTIKMGRDCPVKTTTAKELE
jgi:hypothetical protein